MGRKALHSDGSPEIPLQYSWLENPRDGGAWWAAAYAVAQSRTRLKRLSSSSSWCNTKSIEIRPWTFLQTRKAASPSCIKILRSSADPYRGQGELDLLPPDLLETEVSCLFNLR